MATYKEIRGTQIEVLESDPSNAVEGQVWYNSTDNVLKGDAGTPVLVWTTTNPMNSGRYGLGSAGTQTAFIVIGGDTNINPHSTQTICEQYDGSAFSTIPSLSAVGQNFRGTGGTTSSAYAAGGFDSSGNNTGRTEEFTGESSALNVVTVSTS